MKHKTTTIILVALLFLAVLASCKNDPGCTIRFYANGGTGEMQQQTFAAGQTASLKANAFTRENHIFISWNTKADGSGTSYNDCALVTVSGDMTLYAQWAVRGVSITFDSNNGSGETASQVVPLNTPAALRANTFQNADYGFACWNTRADGSGASLYDCAQIEAPQKMTLYAQWGVLLTDDIVSLTGSIYILNSNVTWNDRKFVYNNVRLLLHDGFTLTAEKGIYVPSGAILIIDADGEGTGRIVASSTDNAGIGGGGGGDKGGTIIINGGIINAESGTGAGIGGGIGTNGCHVTINNGTITATSTSGAGIGGGQSGAGGPVTINNGTITATSDSGAGIGGGDNGNGGPVTINNGAINAASNSGAGIGRGDSGTSDGALDLGTGVSLIVSDNGSDWSSYDGTRKPYMKTPDPE